MALMRRTTAKRKKDPTAGREDELLAKAIAYAVGCQSQGRRPDAETPSQRVLKARPPHFDAWHLLGVLRQQQGRSVEALGLIASALEVSPDQANGWADRGG